MTDKDLRVIRARVEAASPGPWRALDSVAVVFGAGDKEVCDATFDGQRIDGDPDAEFIAAARTDVPALLDEVERLRTGLSLAWSDGWQAALDRPADAEQAIRYRDLQHVRQVRDILTGVTVE